MTRDELLNILKLLSALEAIGVMASPGIPKYLLEELSKTVGILRREILK